jgi:hypothetical protein
MNKKIVLLIPALVGCIFLFLTVPAIIKSMNLKNHGVSTESTVLNSQRMSSSHGPSSYKVTVSFIVSDGSTVTAAARKRHSVHNGEKVMINYDPVAPQTIDFNDSIGYNMKGAVVGGLFFLLGFYLFIRQIASDSSNAKLMKSGRKIEAEYTIGRDERFKAGDNNPWLIKCKWTDKSNNLEYFFVSKPYKIDPAPFLTGRLNIDVFINPDDPSKYYMDTSFMPKGNNTIG